MADLDEWLEWSSATTYADDTTTGVSHKDLEVVLKRLEIDAKNVLQFMASNGLVANPKKTTFIILNQRQRKEEIVSIKIGNEIVNQEKSAKLLGVSFDSNQGWKTQIYGSGGVIMSLNRRLFAIRRLKNHLNEKCLLKLADGLFTSKIRFGLQLLAKVRLTDDDPHNQDIENIQKVQNKLLRMLTNTKLLDMVSTASLLTKTNSLSVNQMNAQIKIQEIWKSIHLIDYPIQLPRQLVQEAGPSTRNCTKGRLIESGFSSLSQKTCINDAVRLWNSLPDSVTLCESLSQVKKQAKLFAKTLPV